MRDLVFALGAILAVEGLTLAIAPWAMRAALARLAAESDERLRAGGLIAAGAGVLLLWMVAS